LISRLPSGVKAILVSRLSSGVKAVLVSSLSSGVKAVFWLSLKQIYVCVECPGALSIPPAEKGKRDIKYKYSLYSVHDGARTK
jgi:hypothetical protein